MKITFAGAARTVTGSCYILEAGGHRFAVDCGMHQGNKEIEKRNNNHIDDYHPASLEFVLLTHAHIDHSGLLPWLVRNGFKGDIYATLPTRDLVEILLNDSAHIQEMEAGWENKRRQRHGRPQLILYMIRKTPWPPFLFSKRQTIMLCLSRLLESGPSTMTPVIFWGRGSSSCGWKKTDTRRSWFFPEIWDVPIS